MSVLYSQSQQKLSVLADAVSASLWVLAVVDIDAETKATDLARQTFAAFGMGAMRGGAHQLYLLRAPNGMPALYAQPFENRLPLPGEHHVLLPMALPAPAIFESGFMGGSWKSPDPAVKAWLKKHPAEQAIDRADFRWKLGAGEIKRSWLALLTPVPDGRTHLVLKATGESDVSFHTRPVGFSLVNKVVAALMQQPPPAGAQATAGQPLAEAAYSQVFFECLQQTELPVLPRGDLSGRELGHPTHAMLAPQAKGKLLVAPLPPAKESNIRRHVMPPEAAHLPIVAAVDLTMMGSAKDALALTPTHCFAHHDSQRIAFDWAELREVAEPEGDELRVRLAERGWVMLSVGDHGPALHALFREIAALPPRS